MALAKRRQRERQAQAVAAAAVSHEADVQEVQARRVGRNLGFAQVQMSNEEMHTPVVEGGAGEDSPAGRQEGQGVKSSTARVRKHRERQRALAAASGIGECSVRHKQDVARKLAHHFLGLTSAYTADCRREQADDRLVWRPLNHVYVQSGCLTVLITTGGPVGLITTSGWLWVTHPSSDPTEECLKVQSRRDNPSSGA